MSKKYVYEIPKNCSFIYFYDLKLLSVNEPGPAVYPNHNEFIVWVRSICLWAYPRWPNIYDTLRHLKIMSQCRNIHEMRNENFLGPDRFRTSRTFGNLSLPWNPQPSFFFYHYELIIIWRVHLKVANIYVYFLQYLPNELLIYFPRQGLALNKGIDEN